MSTHVDSREIVVNMLCIEKGIIPFLGVEMEHVSDTLRNMSEKKRRATIRKFRKILKKAIRHEAASWHNMGSCQYFERIEILRLNAGLGQGSRGPTSKKLSTRSCALRRTLVARYLAMTVPELNS